MPSLRTSSCVRFVAAHRPARHRSLLALALTAFASAACLCLPTLLFAQAGTTLQLPTFGVAIDAKGVVAVQQFNDPDGSLRRAREHAARQALPRDIVAKAPLRKVSLTRLEAEIARRAAQGEKIDDAMRYLAGLQRVQFVFVYPEQHEIVLAGPAEGWLTDLSGRAVGIQSGRPVLELADFTVALRAYPPGRPAQAFVGCTIDPDPEGLLRLRAFQRSQPRAIRREELVQHSMNLTAGMQASLGMSNVRVFGIPADTHFAAVLVEADYRMKRIGIGVERAPIRLSSYLDLLVAGTGGSLQRWWFVPDYKCLRLADDKLAAELLGDGVQLLAEDKLIGPDGQLAAKGLPPNRASEAFTKNFTKRYSELAAASPVYAQMRNLIDMLVVAAHLEHNDLYRKSGWSPTALLDEQRVPIRTDAAPKQAASAANAVVRNVSIIAAVGGGVSIRAEQALAPENVLADDDGELRVNYVRQRTLPKNRWWWD